MATNKLVVEKLETFGIKPSLQRIAILKYLLANCTHPTVDEIYEALHEEIPTLSKTTVYNTLKLFESTSLITALKLDEKELHFDGELEPHAHFICTKCGAIQDIFLKQDSERLTPPELDSVNIKKVELSYYGLCTTCK